MTKIGAKLRRVTTLNISAKNYYLGLKKTTNPNTLILRYFGAPQYRDVFPNEINNKLFISQNCYLTA